MTPPEYVRPKTVPDALKALRGGKALAGGTTLTPRARHLTRLVDLQDLALDGLGVDGDQVRIGAMLRVQQLVEAAGNLPGALIDACLHEASLNLRNMSSMAGALIASTGRSPAATALLALHAQVRLEPGPEQWSLDELLDRRHAGLDGRLVTEILIQLPGSMAFASVARSPADRPIVCTAVARLAGRAPSFGVALGGFGMRPILVPQAEEALAAGDMVGAAQAARAAYEQAEDAWGSGEYRAHVAATLVRRLAAEVGA
jgi:carbon-monoxide dehydrogenase medium subunit